MRTLKVTILLKKCQKAQNDGLVYLVRVRGTNY